MLHNVIQTGSRFRCRNSGSHACCRTGSTSPCRKHHGLVGTYTDPRHVIAYSDGEVRRQFNVCFNERIVAGSLTVSDESTEARFVDLSEIDALPMHRTQRLRLRHFLENRPSLRSDQHRSVVGAGALTGQCPDVPAR